MYGVRVCVGSFCIGETNDEGTLPCERLILPPSSAVSSLSVDLCLSVEPHKTSPSGTNMFTGSAMALVLLHSTPPDILALAGKRSFLDKGQQHLLKKQFLETRGIVGCHIVFDNVSTNEIKIKPLHYWDFWMKWTQLC